ncbi:MAG: MAPEG family protein [Gammaproteobacteria bacterium]|nr:MAPEG family protein [Gammaproteobacteria bacterium]
MIFTVTPIFALPVAVIYMVLWMRVTSKRSALAQSIGDGGNIDLLLRIRQHGNCAEWSCFLLILMILSEGMGAPSLYLYIGGALLVLGRIAHPFGLKKDNAAHVLRYVGNGSNMLATVNFMICIGVNLVRM